MQTARFGQRSYDSVQHNGGLFFNEAEFEDEPKDRFGQLHYQPRVLNTIFRYVIKRVRREILQ